MVNSSELNEDFIRHTILNTIRSIKMKHQEEYGSEVILACDDRHYWRKSKFPYYKAGRREARDKIDIDWDAVFGAFHTIKDELKEFFPYKTLQISGAEADDVIAALAHEFGNTKERILIVSSDKDFVQLQKFNNVFQYSPMQKTYVATEDPEEFLIDHVLRGDKGDGIPNIYSPDSCLTQSGYRQSAITKKRKRELIDQIFNNKIPFPEDRNLRKNYFRNLRLIDLSRIPRKLNNEIISAYKNYDLKSKQNLFSYFVSKKLVNLMQNIGDF